MLLEVNHVLLLCSDALFLDLALEGTARRAVEAALPTLRAAVAASAGSSANSDGHPAGACGGDLSDQPSRGSTAAGGSNSTADSGSVGVPESQLRPLLRVAAAAGVAAVQSVPGDAELALAVRGVQVLLPCSILLSCSCTLTGNSLTSVFCSCPNMSSMPLCPQATCCDCYATIA